MDFVVPLGAIDRLLQQTYMTRLQDLQQPVWAGVLTLEQVDFKCI